MDCASYKREVSIWGFMITGIFAHFLSVSLLKVSGNFFDKMFDVIPFDDSFCQWYKL